MSAHAFRNEQSRPWKAERARCMHAKARAMACHYHMFAAGLRAFSCGKPAKSDKDPFLAASRPDDDGDSSGSLPGRRAAGCCRQGIACLSCWRVPKDKVDLATSAIMYTVLTHMLTRAASAIVRYLRGTAIAGSHPGPAATASLFRLWLSARFSKKGIKAVNSSWKAKVDSRVLLQTMPECMGSLASSRPLPSAVEEASKTTGALNDALGRVRWSSGTSGACSTCKDVK